MDYSGGAILNCVKRFKTQIKLKMEISEKKIVVVGLGVTGIAVSKFLAKRNAHITAIDSAPESTLGDVPQWLKKLGIRTEFGSHSHQPFQDADLIVVSPGVPHELPVLNQARKMGIPVIGEIELASRFILEPMIAVSGTNGKTTTTTLLGEMLKESGFSVFVGGNIGNPLITYADDHKKADWLVVELSSFQLDTIDQFRPQIAVLLNISKDHMDRYPDFKTYVNSKRRLFENQLPEDVAVLNIIDPVIRDMSRSVRSKPLWVSSETGYSQNDHGYAIIDYPEVQSPSVSIYLKNEVPFRIDLKKFSLPGFHNLQNAAAACLSALSAGASKEGIQNALQNFKGLPHRLEKVATLKGIDFVNDSKATNVDAAIKAIETFDTPLILILGGRDKGNDFSPLKHQYKKVKLLVLLGEAAQTIYDTLEGLIPCQWATDMDDAVLKAYKAAGPNETVLLAPACASFDKYKSYKDRGEHFKRAVHRIASGLQ